MICTADDLLARFLRLTESSEDLDEPGKPHWLRVWSLFLEHAWFQEQLRWCASWAARGHSGGKQLVDDVYQEVACGLAKKFQWKVDLNFDRHSNADEFAKWLRTVLVRDCRRALARHIQDRDQSLGEPPAVACEQEFLEMWDTLGTLPPAERPIVGLYIKGFSYRAIEAQLDTPYWTVRRVVLRWARTHFADWADSHKKAK